METEKKENKYEVVILDGEQYLAKEPKCLVGCHLCCFAKEQGEANTCKYAGTCMAHLREDRRSIYYSTIEENTMEYIRNKWTTEQEKFLIENYENMTALQIARKLNKTITQVYHKKSNLNLKKS